MSYTRLIGIIVGSDIKYYNLMSRTHHWKPVTRGVCLRAYKHMVKVILNPCGTLGS